MKHNLKNRPKLYKNCMSVFHKDAIRWFAGFEAELRENLVECEKMIKKYPDDAVGLAGQLQDKARIKEILGE